MLFLLQMKTHVLKNLWHRRGILISREDCFSWQHFYVFLFIVFQPIRSWWGEVFFLTWLYKSQCCSLEGWQGCRLICSSKSFVSLQGSAPSISLLTSGTSSSRRVSTSENGFQSTCAGFLILCSRLTSHGFQMPHVSHSHKSHRNRLGNWLRQRLSRSAEQLDLPLHIPLSVSSVRVARSRVVLLVNILLEYLHLLAECAELKQFLKLSTYIPWTGIILWE